MNNDLKKLAREYAVDLRKYLDNQQEAVLEQAYELGRTAIGKGLGVLDVARVHQESLKKLFRTSAAANDSGRILKAAEVFLLESLSPFEATHRGFREMNVKLQERNQELEKEIAQRRKVEDALRQSEKHYRCLFSEAQEMQENLRNLSDKILRTQEEERKRISRELHDEVGQSLTAISVTLATLHNDGDHSKKIADSQTLLRETMETVHSFARDLRPTMLDELGLVPALRSYLNGFASRTGLDVRFRADSAAEKLADDQKTVLYRIAQESLNNVTKHAQASQVMVAVRKFKNGICMEIADNGVSFKTDPMNAGKSKGRLGLLGMQERVRLVSGQFVVNAKPGQGTTIRVVIPFNSPRTTMAPARLLNQFNGKGGFVRPLIGDLPRTD